MPKKREDDLNWFSWTAHIKCPLNTLEPFTGLTSNFLQWSPLGYIVRARPLKTSVTFFVFSVLLPFHFLNGHREYERIYCSVLSFPSVHMVSPKLRKAFKTKRCIGICQERWEKVSFIKLGLIYFSFMHFVRSCRSVAPGLMDDMPSIRIVSGWELQTYSLFFFR